MRKNITAAILLLIFALPNAFPQLMSIKRGPKYAFDFDISPKFGVGASSLSNANIILDPNVSTELFGLTYSYGGKLGLTFISASPRYVFFTVYADYLFNSFNQLYTLKDFTDSNNPVDFNKTISSKGRQMDFMFRITGFPGSDHISGKYIEFGIRNNTGQTVTESYSGITYTNPVSPILKYKPDYKSFVVGIGFYATYANIGIRTSFSLDDIMNENYNPVSDGIYQSTNTDYSTNYSIYAPTKLFTVELVLEINLYFLEIGTASCGKLAATPFPFFLNHDYIW